MRSPAALQVSHEDKWLQMHFCAFAQAEETLL